MAGFYKYFTEKEHMESFIQGNIRFSSLAYYKQLEQDGTISDRYEGERIFFT